MHGPAGIPETRFHFRQKCLRLGRVGNTCTSSCAISDTPTAQHKRRVFITFRGNRGQSHLSRGRRAARPCFRRPRSPPPDLGLSRKAGFRRGIRLTFRRGSQLISGELPATGAATPLHVREGQRIGRTLRLPRSRHFAMAGGTVHWRPFLLSVRSRKQLAPNPARLPLLQSVLCGPPYQSGICLLLTGRMVALDTRLLSSVMPSTFLACCFAFSSVRNRLGWRGVLLPVRNSTR
jgi:hypothetical protein